MLSEALAHFRQLVVPSSVQWELLVIDNNSSDDTCSVVRQLTGS